MKVNLDVLPFDVSHNFVYEECFVSRLALSAYSVFADNCLSAYTVYLDKQLYT